MSLDKLKKLVGEGKVASLFGINREDIERLRRNMQEVVTQLQETNRKLDEIIKLLKKNMKG